MLKEYDDIVYFLYKYSCYWYMNRSIVCCLYVGNLELKLLKLIYKIYSWVMGF